MVFVRLARALVGGVVAAVLGAGCWRTPPLRNPGASLYRKAAPDSFDVLMVTTKGPMTVRVRRTWSPTGADRFHALVRARYFDDVAFHRVIRNFVAQFGIHGDTAVSAIWRGKSIRDDSVRAPNRKGTLSYARGGANTRSTQLFSIRSTTPRASIR